MNEVETVIIKQEKQDDDQRDPNIDKISAIIKKEFNNDIRQKEKHLDLIEQTISSAKKMFMKLRYGIVNNYYNSKHLQLTGEEIQSQLAEQQDPIEKAKVYSVLTNKDRPLHPATKRLLNESESSYQSPFTIRPPRKRSKAGDEKSDIKLPITDHLKCSIKNEPSTSGLQENYSNHSTESNKIEENDTQKTAKIPRYIKPKDLDKNVLKVDPASRNQQKEKFRIIIGNTSKYIGAQSESDKSTHRWLLYIRGPREKPDISHFVTSVTVQLHDSYAPHNIIHIASSPFHLTRRGWGEFPVKLRIQFKNKTLNKPVNLVHQLKLDRLYTGLQTLGCETVVDVYLYTDETMVEKVTPSKLKNNEESKSRISPSPKKNDVKSLENFEDKRKNVKKSLNEISTIKENGFYNKKNMIKQTTPEKISLLKCNQIDSVPEVSTLLNGYNLDAFQNDHCYIKTITPSESQFLNGLGNNIDNNFFITLRRDVSKLSDVKSAVSLLLKKLPIVDETYKNENLLRIIPFAVSSAEKYFSYNLFKRRNLEWCRAKMISDILKTSFYNLFPNRQLRQWSIKQIIIFSHYHGYYPVKNDTQGMGANKRYRNGLQSSDDAFENSGQINTKTKFEMTFQSKTEHPSYHRARLNSYTVESEPKEDEEDVDICSQTTLDDRLKVKIKSESLSENAPDELEALPFVNDDEKLQCYFVESKCAELGIHLRNEDVGNGYSFSMPHKVILTAVKCLVEDLLRRSLDIKLRTELKSDSENAEQNPCQDVTKSCIWKKIEPGKPQQISLKHIFEAVKSRPEFDFLTNLDLGTDAIDYKGSL